MYPPAWVWVQLLEDRQGGFVMLATFVGWLMPRGEGSLLFCTLTLGRIHSKELQGTCPMCQCLRFCPVDRKKTDFPWKLLQISPEASLKSKQMECRSSHPREGRQGRGAVCGKRRASLPGIETATKQGCLRRRWKSEGTLPGYFLLTTFPFLFSP